MARFLRFPKWDFSFRRIEDGLGGALLQRQAQRA
jgi:hypothetical protein